MFVFLLLAAQYESILLPLAVILIMPMCLLAAIGGVLFRGMDNNILTQIGFVVLVGLAAKNAILIVEFARQAEERVADRQEAAVQCRPHAAAADPDASCHWSWRRERVQRCGRRSAPRCFSGCSE